MQRLCGARLCRPYPSRWRTDSSNADPLKMWLTGAQHIALNLQTNDLGAQLHAALFSLGGGGGYVLKPRELVAPEAHAPWPPRRETVHRTTLTLLSLHRLPARYEARPALSASHHRYEPGLSGTRRACHGIGAEVSSPSITVELYAIGGYTEVTGTPPHRKSSALAGGSKGRRASIFKKEVASVEMDVAVGDGEEGDADAEEEMPPRRSKKPKKRHPEYSEAIARKYTTETVRGNGLNPCFGDEVCPWDVHN